MGAEFVKKEYKLTFVGGWSIKVALNRVELHRIIRQYPKLMAYEFV